MAIVVIAVGSSDENCPSGAYEVDAAAFDPQTLGSIGRKPYGVSDSVRKHNREEESYGEEGAGGGVAHRDVRSNGERKQRREASKRRRDSFVVGWAHVLLVMLLLMNGSQPLEVRPDISGGACGTRKRDPRDIIHTSS